MGVLKGDARLACVDLSNYAERKHEITKQLMEAATTVGFVICPIGPTKPCEAFPGALVFGTFVLGNSLCKWAPMMQVLLRDGSWHVARSSRPVLRDN